MTHMDNETKKAFLTLGAIATHGIFTIDSLVKLSRSPKGHTAILLLSKGLLETFSSAPTRSGFIWQMHSLENYIDVDERSNHRYYKPILKRLKDAVESQDVAKAKKFEKEIKSRELIRKSWMRCADFETISMFVPGAHSHIFKGDVDIFYPEEIEHVKQMIRRTISS